MKSGKTRSKHANNALLNIITPMGLTFRRNGLTCGENLAKVYGVVKYPASVEIGWLSEVGNMAGTIVSSLFTPMDNHALVENLSRNIVQNRGIAESTRDPLIRQRAEKGATDGERILKQIDQNGESVGGMVHLVMPHAAEDADFQRICRRVESAYTGKRMKVRGLANLQADAYRTLSPYHVPDERIEEMLRRIVPLSTYIGGLPFASSGFNDGSGSYIAKDSAGGLIVLDPWKRGGDRTNSNFIVMGVSGVGKSTAIKSLILTEYMRGTTILVLDVEREYHELCNNLHGDWINAGGGAGGRINPLQVRPAPRDIDVTSEMDDWATSGEVQGISDLALHMNTLEIFFSLYLPGLDDMQKALLRQALEEVYAQYGIGWQTDVSQFPNTAFPTLGDLYRLLEYHRAERERTRGQGDPNPFEALSYMLRGLAEGADSFLWNGHSTLSANGRFICLDTHDLQNTSDNVKRAAYFNALSWCWERMSRDRRERVLLLADEAYLMIDPKVPQSLVFLRNVVKRARKYEAAIAIVSHSVNDFLAPEIRMYGQALLDMPCYKLLMGTDGANLKETAELYDLTEAEQAFLYSRKRGHALLMIGSRRLFARFEIPEYRMRYMGDGGGR